MPSVQGPRHQWQGFMVPQELHPQCDHRLHLCRPLNYFATLYRSIQKDMMNMDQMLAMLDIDPGVKVRPQARTTHPRQLCLTTLRCTRLGRNTAPDGKLLQSVHVLSISELYLLAGKAPQTCQQAKV